MIYLSTASGYLFTVLFLLLVLPLIIIQNTFNNQKLFNHVIRFMCRIVLAFLGISVKVKGLEKLDPVKSYIFIADHMNIFNGFILCGYIPHFIRKVELEEGISLIMLPEGHRKRDGKLLPFMRGPFRLAVETKTYIVLIAMRNAYRRKSVNAKLVRPGKMELQFGGKLPYNSFSESMDSELRSLIYEIEL